jgi:hypothetical protein
VGTLRVDAVDTCFSPSLDEPAETATFVVALPRLCSDATPPTSLVNRESMVRRGSARQGDKSKGPERSS